MTITLTKRHFAVAALLALAVIIGGVLARQALTGVVVNALLSAAGASEIRFTITAASPWRVVVEDIGFSVRTQAFAAGRVTLTRPHWWSPSLGTLRVEQARVPLTIDGSDTNPWSWSTYKSAKTPGAPPSVPLDDISLDGLLVIKAAAVPEQTLAVKVEAHSTAQATWTGLASVDGPGLGVKAEGTFDPATQTLGFKLPAVSLDLKPWQDFIQRLVLLPGGAWEMAGRATASAEGRWAGKEFAATAKVSIRDGHAGYPARGVTADGIEVDLEFTDLDHIQSKPGNLRIRELRAGGLLLRDVDTEFAFDTAKKIVVSRVALKALGGGVAAEPFKYFPDLRELEAVVLVDGISIEEVLAMTKDLPAKATGRLNGRFPLRLDNSGVRLGTGWLQLKPGVAAEVRFNAGGLLTSGLSASSPSYAVLKKVETGLLKLAISEMRLDIRPPNAPPGRSATLHLAGQPVDPDVKAPVTLDLNVNGPLEKLLNLGMDSRLNFGTKP